VREARAQELLKGAAPALVDPGMTAVWEMRLDEVVTGRVHFEAVINEIAAEAAKLIAVLRQHTGALVDLSRPAPIAGRRSRG
jgi:DNA topoisomerase-3